MKKKSLSQLNKRLKRRSRLKRIVATLSAIAVFVTTYALILPAITIDHDTAEEEPGLDVVQEVGTEELVSPESEPGDNTEATLRSASCGDLTVGAELTEGTFDDGVVMDVNAVSDEDVINAAVAVVDGVDHKEADSVRAVEISFTDENGEDGTPEAPMNFTLTGSAISDASDPVIVRVDENLNAEVIDGTMIGDEIAYLAGESGSIYAIVETHEITTRYITADGESYNITVRYDTSAGIPDGAELAVSEIDPESEEYDRYLTSACGELDDGLMISDARFFDISILYDGTEIEPIQEVSVTISYDKPLELKEDSEVLAVHFTDNGTELNYDVTTDGAGEVTFQQDGFSVTGTLVTTPGDLENTAHYIIIAQDGNNFYAMTNTGNNTCTGTQLSGVTLNGDGTVTISGTSNIPDTCLWRFSSGYNTLRNKSSNRYIYMSSSNFTNTSSRSLTIEAQSGGKMSIRYNSYYVRWNGTNFARYSQSSGTPPSFYFVKYETQSDPYGGRYQIRYHYVDEKGNEIDPTVEMYMQATTAGYDLHDTTYAKPISGYTFKEARYGDPEGDRFQYITHDHNTSSGAVIVNFMNDLMYNVLSDHGVQTESFSNMTCAMNVTDSVDLSTDPERIKDVYMVYVGDDTPGPNDHGTQQEDPNNEFPFGAPDHNKRLVPNYTDGNWDGTYTLYLDVTGNAATESGSNKADIILVYDTSNSMHTQDATDENGNNTYRYKVAYNVVMDVAEELYANNANDPDPNDPTVRIGVISYACSAKQEFGYANNLADFTNGFAFANVESTYQKSTYGGTNWEDGLQTAKTLYDAAHRADAEQYIIFVSDGEPTCRVERCDWYEHRDAMEYTMSNNNTTAGPDSDQTNNNKQFYAHGYATMNSGNYLYTGVEHCYTNAKDDAKAFVDAGATFYTVGIFNTEQSLSRMNTLANYAYTGLDYPEIQNDNYKYATNQAILHETFADIIQDISKSFGYGNVAIEDAMTVTALTTGELQGNATDFKYYKNTAGQALTEWPGAPTATYNTATKTVDWDLSSVGMLENNTTYTIGFTVWPDQDAYDAIMVLNDLVDAALTPGSTMTLDDVDAYAQQHYPDIYSNLRTDSSGHYIVQSNASADLSYERFKIENGGTPVSLGQEHAGYSFPNMETTDYYMSVSKYWDDSLQTNNRFQSVVFEVFEDYDDTPGAVNTPYATITLDASDVDPNDPYRWTEQILISPGIFKTEIDPNNPINPGHTYTVKEVGYTDKYGTFHDIHNPQDYTDYRYEFDPETVVPMLYDGVMTLMGDADGDQELTGTNELRGGLNLYKIVLGRDGEEIYTEDEYEFIFHYTVPERFIWGYDDDTGEPIIDPNAFPLWYTMYTDEDYDGNFFGPGDTNSTTNGLPDLGGGWGTLEDGDHIKIKSNQTIRIINVPIGTEYSFEEINVPNGWSFEHAEVEIDGEIVVNQTGPDSQNRNYIEYIAIANSAQENTFYNEMTHYEVKVIKVDEEDNEVVLPGAVFKLYTAPGQDPNDLVTINGQTQFTTGADGYISFGLDLPNDTYYLYEVSPPTGYKPLDYPIVFTVADSGVTYSQSEFGVTNEEAPLTPGTNAPIYTVTAVNESLGEVQIIKIDALDPTNVLEGAVFNLYRAPDGVDEEDLLDSSTGIVDKTLLTIVEVDGERDLETNGNGVIRLGDILTPGVYYLFETVAPEGFMAPKEPVKITVNSNGILYSQKDYNAGQTMTAQLASSGNDPPALTIYVANITGTLLPHTGGAGTQLYTIGGLALICIAVLMLGAAGLKRKRRERRNE